MWRILLVYFILLRKLTGSQESNEEDDRSSRVLGGKPVIPHSHPYIVQIFTNETGKNAPVRQGVLLDPYTILTSGLPGVVYTRVVAGKHLRNSVEITEQTRRVCKMIQHPDFVLTGSGVQNSYELIFVSDPFVFNQYVNRVNVPPKNYKRRGKCTLIAWGATRTGLSAPASNDLRQRVVMFHKESQICGKHPSVECLVEGNCVHDWGGPVMCTEEAKTYLYGLIATVDGKGSCAGNNYVAITSYLITLPWLKASLEEGERECGDD